MTVTRMAAEWFAVVEQLAERDIDPALFVLARERVEWLLRLGPTPADPVDDRLRAAAAFTEQFVIDVAGVTDEQRAALFGALGAESLGFVQALYVVDLATRRRVLRERLIDGAVAPSAGAAADETLWAAIEAFMRAVAKLDALDPLTSELVRLRGAAQHRCRLCRSRRSVVATDAAPADDLLAIAERYETAPIDERRRLALRLTDAMLTQPTELASEHVDAARATFSTDELDELLFDVVRNAANKIAVAFGADAPQVDDGIEWFTIDAAGDVVASTDASALRQLAAG